MRVSSASTFSTLAQFDSVADSTMGSELRTTSTRRGENKVMGF
jgi:hypothetical protein